LCKIEKYVFAFDLIEEESITGEVLKNHIQKIYLKFQLNDKIKQIISDSGSNIK
jgi:hypothetical protein